MTFEEFWTEERNKHGQRYVMLGPFALTKVAQVTWEAARKGMVPVEEVKRAKDESASGEECDAMLYELIKKYGG